jgi:ATP-binding cassette, subfamily C (CFTR/MRP), member 10
MALFNMLVTPLNNFPWVINGLLQGWVSVKRLREYLETKNFNLYSYYKLKKTSRVQNDNILINMSHASFQWNLVDDKEKNIEVVNEEFPVINVDTEPLLGTSYNVIKNERTETILKDISFKIEKSKFYGLIGKTGSGKTSLLFSILGEISKFNDSVSEQEGIIEVDYELLAEGFAYVSQDCWIQAGTIRDNILFGEPYEEEKYRRVVFACALDDDFEVLTRADETKVGENGITLSGGQKARYFKQIN